MDNSAHNTIRGAIEAILAARGIDGPVSDTDSLFISGRLDSLAATEVMMMLESDFNLDLADPDFDMSRLDTIADLTRLVTDMAA
ncbi:phosphopantetheine-binding protein [Nitratireductor sp. XY-223]|uniref:acyl carrier protein n=1 Tax=Nitratireductor sp. XY-223 TaxID=2561926 RepID=UPI00145AC87F|nr:phosphopantetheine-binding protein [Nitratireductor sp. XY-223]